MATNLLQANHQWATRPPDERFWSIEYQRKFAHVGCSGSHALDSNSRTLPLKKNLAFATRSKKTFQALPNREIIVYDKDDCFGFRQ